MLSATENTVHVVLAVYDPSGSYSQHAGVVMASIFEHTKSPVCVHILHDKTLTERNRALLSETAEIFSQKAEFHDVDAYLTQLGDEAIQLARCSTFSVGTLFRLLIPDILSLEKVIYLDCDIVVNMDIKELWDIDLNGCSCAGAADSPAKRFTHLLRLRRMGYDGKHFINAGVLLMNLPKMKEKLNMNQAALWFRRYQRYAATLDQDMINSCFRGEIKFLDNRFNNRDLKQNITFCGDVNAPEVAGTILHGAKPWADLRVSAQDRLYWRIFFKTPWGKGASPGEIVDIMLNAAEKSPAMHRRTSQCYKNVARRLRSDVLRNELFMLMKFFASELYFKAKDFFKRK